MTDLLPILTPPDPRLRQKARPVTEADADHVRRLAERMLATMYAAPGIGLAAPQVGEGLRLFVMDVAGKNETPAPQVLLNPEILEASRETELREEGCLSLPNQYADIERPFRIRARWLDLTGRKHEAELDALAARCFQHELDHLNGVLFVDHLSILKRNMILRKLAKELKAKGR
ncbi:MAG: peptide deformylase [Acetobacteraceae bacterium]|nr:peptide deformylase [Acetobacteraceae bacterium]MCX7683911.1 peptide deformylase [Acetobacteraceae bacterium]MDW8399055.1 peptide deformylase [Acetobacteraceae bacterium]